MRSSKLLKSLSGNLFHTVVDNILSVRNLLTLKQKALRRGLWYKAINRLDRLLVNLTLKVSRNIQSKTLLTELLVVVQKLQTASESKLEHAIRTVGFPLAQKLSIFAKNWHCTLAEKWATDKGFACYLAIMNLNGLT